MKCYFVFVASTFCTSFNIALASPGEHLSQIHMLLRSHASAVLLFVVSSEFFCGTAYLNHLTQRFGSVAHFSPSQFSDHILLLDGKTSFGKKLSEFIRRVEQEHFVCFLCINESFPFCYTSTQGAVS